MIRLLLIFFLLSGVIELRMASAELEVKSKISNQQPTSLSPKITVADTVTDAKDIYKYDEPQRPTTMPPVFIFIRALVALLIVILLIYGSVYLLKLTWGKKPLYTPGAISVMDSFYLSQNKSIHILDIAGTVYIIGVSEKGMDLIKEITDEVNINKIKSILQEKRTPSFKSYFSEFTKRFANKGEEEASTTYTESSSKSTFSGISNLKESINKLRTEK